MLQDIRKGISGLTAKIIIGLIVISFSIFGIESVLFGGGGNSAAEVNGEEIQPGEVEALVRNQKQRLLQIMGDEIDPAMLDDAMLSASALDSLIGRRLLMQNAKDMGLMVPERAVGRLIGSMEQFQINGEFSPEMYRSVVASAGLTPAMFQRSLQQDLVVNQLRTGLAGSEFVTPAELELNARITAEQRSFRFIELPRERYEAAVSVSDDEVASFYNANSERYLTQETVDLDYIVLSADQFRPDVDDAALRAEYEIELDNYQYETERRVSHLLLEPGDDEAEFAQRVAVVEQRLAAGEALAALASTLSDDIGSAELGGDLGYTSGDVFPEAMERAISELAVGETSGPVITDAGTHFITVTELRDGEPPSFDELRPQLVSRLQDSEAERELLLAVETLKDLVFSADGLEIPAQELDLAVSSAKGISREQAEGLFASPRLRQAAFSDDVLGERHNSEVLELADGRHVVMQVTAHALPEPMPLESVSQRIRSDLLAQRAEQAMQDEASSIIDALRAGESVEDVATRLSLQWRVEIGAQRDTLSVPAALAEAVFALPGPAAEGEAVFEVTPLAADDLALVQLFRVTPGQLSDLQPREREVLGQQLVGETGQLVDTQYQNGLRERADITVY